MLIVERSTVGGNSCSRRYDIKISGRKSRSYWSCELGIWRCALIRIYGSSCGVKGVSNDIRWIVRRVAVGALWAIMASLQRIRAVK